jgi:chromosome segregation ATPase
VSEALRQKESACSTHRRELADLMSEIHVLRLQAAPTQVSRHRLHNFIALYLQRAQSFAVTCSFAQHLIEARDLELVGARSQLNDANTKLNSANYRVEEVRTVENRTMFVSSHFARSLTLSSLFSLLVE